jgi:hypothetical protein
LNASSGSSGGSGSGVDPLQVLLADQLLAADDLGDQRGRGCFDLGIAAYSHGSILLVAKVGVCTTGSSG